MGYSKKRTLKSVSKAFTKIKFKLMIIQTQISYIRDLTNNEIL